MIKDVFRTDSTLYYNLLQSDEYMRLSAAPSLFREEIESRDSKITHVIVDEIQHVPELLNEIHLLLESSNHPFFCLSGSSARKLIKRTSLIF